MVTIPTKAYKHLTLPYLINIVRLIHVYVLATHPQRAVHKGHITKTLRTNANACDPHSPLSLSLFDSRRGYSPPNSIKSAYVLNIILTTISPTCYNT